MQLKPVILHADLDCFYCQVEKLRLDLPDDQPMAVQQWSNVIAVNYAARYRGVSRHLSSADCLKQCPEMVFVHVPTYSIKSPGEVFRYPAKGAIEGEPVPIGADRAEHKASLSPYRKASLEIFIVFHKFADILEKGGLDEAFIDVSKRVDRQLEDLLACDVQIVSEEGVRDLWKNLDWEGLGVPAIKELESLELSLEEMLNEIRIWIGAKFALEIRLALKSELGYTCSVGIAHNKMLAKLGSARNKPFNQTYMQHRMVEALMKEVPLKKIRFLGGKLGALLCSTIKGDEDDDEIKQRDEDANIFDVDDSDDEALSHEKDNSTVMASDLWSLSVNELSYRLDGDRQSAEWTYDIIRGVDTSTVTPRSKPKSFMAAKSLRPALKGWSQIECWLKLLSLELWERLEEDYQVNQRWPRTINLTFKSFNNDLKSQSTEFPIFSPNLFVHDTLVQFLIKLMHASSTPVFPCNRLTISVSKFMPLQDEVDGKRWSTMDRFTIKRSFNPFDETPRDEEIAYVPPPKKSKTIARSNVFNFFFPPKPKQNREGQVDEWRCSDCDFAISMFEIDLIQEHQDYHLALKLQN